MRSDEEIDFYFFLEFFNTELKCRNFLVSWRWPDGVRCPKCQNPNVYELRQRRFHWQCQKCLPKGYRFSVLVGTPFEGTKCPLPAWFFVVRAVSRSHGPIAGRALHRVWKEKYQARASERLDRWERDYNPRLPPVPSLPTLFFLLQRVRAALQDPDFCSLAAWVSAVRDLREPTSNA